MNVTNPEFFYHWLSGNVPFLAVQTNTERIKQEQQMSSWMLTFVFVSVKWEGGFFKKLRWCEFNKKSLEIIPNGAMIQVVKKHQVLIQ